MLTGGTYREEEDESLFGPDTYHLTESDPGFFQTASAGFNLAKREGGLYMALEKYDLDNMGNTEEEKFSKGHWEKQAKKDEIDISGLELDELNQSQYDFIKERKQKIQRDQTIIHESKYGMAGSLPGGIAGGLLYDPAITLASGAAGSAAARAAGIGIAGATAGGGAAAGIQGAARGGSRIARNIIKSLRLQKTLKKIGETGVGKALTSDPAKLAGIAVLEGIAFETAAINGERYFREQLGEEMTPEEVRARMVLSPLMGAGIEAAKGVAGYLTRGIRNRLNRGNKGAEDGIIDRSNEIKLLEAPEPMKLLEGPEGLKQLTGEGPIKYITGPDGNKLLEGPKGLREISWSPTTERLRFEDTWVKTHSKRGAQAKIRRILGSGAVEKMSKRSRILADDQLKTGDLIIELDSSQFKNLTEEQQRGVIQGAARRISDKAREEFIRWFDGKGREYAQFIGQNENYRSPQDRASLLVGLDSLDQMEEALAGAKPGEFKKIAKKYLDPKRIEKTVNDNPVVKALEDINDRLNDPNLIDDAEINGLVSERNTLLEALDEEEVRLTAENDPRVRRLEDLYEEKRSTYDDDIIDEIEAEQFKIIEKMQSPLLERLGLERGADPNIVKDMATEEMDNITMDIRSEASDPIDFILLDDNGNEITASGKEPGEPSSPSPLQQELLEIGEEPTAADFIRALDEGKIKSPEVKQMAEELKEYGEDFYEYDTAQRYVDSEKAADAESIGMEVDDSVMMRDPEEVKGKFSPPEETQHLREIAKSKLLDGEDPRELIADLSKSIDRKRAATVLQGDVVQTKRMANAFTKLDSLDSPELRLAKMSELSGEVRAFKAKRRVESLAIDGGENKLHEGFMQSERVGIPPQPGPRSKFSKKQYNQLYSQVIQYIRQNLIDGNEIRTRKGINKGRKIIYADTEGNIYYEKIGKHKAKFERLDQGFTDKKETTNYFYTHPMRRSNFESAVLDKGAPIPKKVPKKYTKKEYIDQWNKQEKLGQTAHEFAQTLDKGLAEPGGYEKAAAGLGKYYDEAITSAKRRQEMKEKIEEMRDLTDEKVEEIILCTIGK